MSKQLAPMDALRSPDNNPMQRLLAEVLDELGGIEFVVDWAEENPDKFMSIFVAAHPTAKPGANQPAAGPSININLPPALAPGPLDKGPVTVVGDQESDD